MKTVGLVLAAGQSRRFGAPNKLLAPYAGRPLIMHAADALRGCALDALVATTADQAVQALLPDFACVEPKGNTPEQSASLRAGVRACLPFNPARILIVLADMPNITTAHLQVVVARCSEATPSASTDGTRSMPPACFPASMARQLMALDGDRGAGPLLKTLPPEALVEAPALLLKDVDVPADLAAADSPAADLAADLA